MIVKGTQPGIFGHDLGYLLSKRPGEQGVTRTLINIAHKKCQRSDGGIIQNDLNHCATIPSDLQVLPLSIALMSTIYP